jgi:hypothetical protein
MKKYSYTSEFTNEEVIVTSHFTKEEVEMLIEQLILWEGDNPDCVNERAQKMEKLRVKLDIRLEGLSK